MLRNHSMPARPQPEEIQQAERRIRPYTLTTPLLHSLSLSKEGKANVHLKLESEQHTGSFKARGAMNKVLSLTEAEKEQGVLTASTGNHGQALARALKLTGVHGVIFLPENADPSKIEAIQQYDVPLEFYGTNALATELYAKAAAKERGMVWVSPYNDPQVIAGQGTIGVELVQQLKDIDYVFVTIGGGGLMSGVAAYLKSASPRTKFVGCLPENSAEMYHSVKAGKFVEVESHETLSDGSAGGFEEGSITFEFCRRLVDDYVLVTESEIKSAVRLVVDRHHKIIEGAAGVALASYIKQQELMAGRNVIIVICGGNIATAKLKSILC